VVKPNNHLKQDMSKTVLVVECQGNLNWYDIFEGATFDGQSVKIEQAEWDDIT